MPFSPLAEKQIKKSYTRAPATHKRKQALQETLQKYALQKYSLATKYSLQNSGYKNNLRKRTPKERITKIGATHPHYLAAVQFHAARGDTLRTRYNFCATGTHSRAALRDFPFIQING